MFLPEEEAGEVREENSGEPISSTSSTNSDPIPEEVPTAEEIPVTEESPAAAPEAATPVSDDKDDEGYNDPVYADAHYEPEGESTVPPRYYCPPERPVREARERKKKRSSGGGLLKAACLALVCAMLGGFVGSAITAGSLSDKVDALEQRVASAETAVSSVSAVQTVVSASPVAVSGESGVMSPAQIYDMACRQVVGVTTDVTYTNYFGMKSSSAVSGSGFIISTDGYILTNYHVIEYAVQLDSPITVMTYDGTKYTATIVGTEQSNDIAVLKIDATGLSPATFASSDSLHVGDTVYAVGNPLGELEFSMSTGHVSALDRVITTQEQEAINMFQIDAAVNPGNSGGPVYNSLGQVVGVVTAKYSSTGVEGLGFAIPSNDVTSIANDLITKGYVTGKAYMGVWMDERYSAMYAQYYNMPLGAYISDVGSGSCAEKAGIQKGDIITRLGGKEVSSYTELKNIVKNYSAGDVVEVELYRAGESMTVTLTFDEAKPESA